MLWKAVALGIAASTAVVGENDLPVCKGREAWTPASPPCEVRECRAIAPFFKRWGKRRTKSYTCIRAPTCEELRASDDWLIRWRSSMCRTLDEQVEEGRSQCLQSRKSFPFALTTNRFRNHRYGGDKESCEGNTFWFGFCVTEEGTETSKPVINQIRPTRVQEGEELFAVASQRAGCAGKRSTSTIRPYDNKCGETYALQLLQDTVNAVGGKLSKETVTLDGYERSYFVFRSYLNTIGASGDPAPLVVDLHGLTSCAEVVAVYSGWLRIAAQQNMVVLWPQSTELIGNNILANFQQQADLSSWAAETLTVPANSNGVDDVKFLHHIIDSVQGDQDMNIDRKRLYMAGHSNGAAMSQQFAYENPDMVAAVATHALFLTAVPQDLASQQDLLEYTEGNDNVEFDPNAPLFFKLASKVPVVSIHGTGDATIPYDQITCPEGSGPSCFYSPGAVTNNYLWAALNDLDVTKPVVYTSPDGEYATQTYSANGTDVNVQLISVFGANHVTTLFSEIEGKVDTTGMAWDFIKDFKK